MKKWIFGAGIVLCLGVGSLAVYQKIMNDRQAPEIFIDGEMVYQDGMQEELLEGVTAKDEQDGDVTASLVVETVSPNAKSGTAVVIYAARDNSNNIAKASRVVEYLSAEPVVEEETEELEENDKKAKTEAAKNKRTEVGLGAGLGNTVGTVSSESEDDEDETEAVSEEEVETELESEFEELEPGCPVLKLTELSATIKVGETFNPLIYVASIEDDYDNIYELWQNIQLEGEYDVDKAGKYELTFHVVDSAGNMSNVAKFVLTVEEE